MKKKINPEESNREEAFQLWMKSPMPMVTLTKTFDITRLYKFSKRKDLKFNMLLCWCIAKAASRIEEFYSYPIEGDLYKFDQLAVSIIVNNKEGGISSCDIPFTDDLKRFNSDYLRMSKEVTRGCYNIDAEESAVIGTSAVVATELDCIVNQYTEMFCNPMVMWGKYRKSFFKVTLPISFQFHHVQMDGGHAALFFEQLQKTMNKMG